MVRLRSSRRGMGIHFVEAPVANPAHAAANMSLAEPILDRPVRTDLRGPSRFVRGWDDIGYNFGGARVVATCCRASRRRPDGLPPNAFYNRQPQIRPVVTGFAKSPARLTVRAFLRQIALLSPA